jgi:hypothetical protein
MTSSMATEIRILFMSDSRSRGGKRRPALVAHSTKSSFPAIGWRPDDLNQNRAWPVLGFFDISQRLRVERDLLSVTLPYRLFLALEEDVDASFLTTETW